MSYHFSAEVSSIFQVGELEEMRNKCHGTPNCGLLERPDIP